MVDFFSLTSKQQDYVKNKINTTPNMANFESKRIHTMWVDTNFNNYYQSIALKTILPETGKIMQSMLPTNVQFSYLLEKGWTLREGGDKNLFYSKNLELINSVPNSLFCAIARLNVKAHKFTESFGFVKIGEGIIQGYDAFVYYREKTL